MRLADRRAARGTLQLMMGRLSLFACGYLTAVMLARGLGPAAYGVYGLILSVLLWIEHVADCGIPEAVAKLSPEDEGRAAALEDTAHTLLLIVSLFLFGVFWLVAPLLADLFELPEGTALIRLALIDVPLTGLYFAYQGTLAGRRNFGALSLGFVVYGLTKLVGIGVASLMGLSVFWALVVNSVGTLGGLLCLVVHVSPVRFRPSLSHTRTILGVAFPVALFLLALQILAGLDLWSLKVLGTEGAETIGMYVAALNIARIPALAFSAVNGVILPSVSLALARNDMAMTRRYVQGAGRFLWVTLLPACVVVALTAEELMLLVYSRDYLPGAGFLVAQVFGFAFLGTAQVFCEMLIARGTPYVAAAATLAQVPLATLLNVILIPQFGGMGAALALTITFGLLAGATGCLAARHFGSPLALGTFLRVILATAVAAVVATQIAATGVWLGIKYLVLGGVYVFALVLMRELTRHDLQPLVFWSRGEPETVVE
jgi:stage V sporulation protein B